MTTVPTLSDFRAQIRAFHDGLPATLAEFPDGVERMRAYRRALHEAGLSGITLPVELGGQGLPDEYGRAFREEKGDQAAPEEAGLAIGLGMALPTILDHGSPALRRRFVPSGLRGEEIWCQLYSEPGAGSDLEDKVILGDPGKVDNALAVVAVDQKVLTECFLGCDLFCQPGSHVSIRTT